jgi:hypothetical protein
MSEMCRYIPGLGRASRVICPVEAPGGLVCAYCRATAPSG